MPYTSSMTAPGPIDCDLHPTVPGLPALMPYLDEVWRESAQRRGFEPAVPISYPTVNPLSVRSDWRGADGLGATDATRLAEQALAPFGTQTAILNCLYGAPVLFSDDLASAFCRAVNDWVAAEWLGRDPRLRASIVVPQLNAERAVDEIERRAADPRFAQVLLLASGELPLGKRQHWPIYAAAERHGLPVGVHAGSTYRHPPSAGGWGSTYLEDYVSVA
ncbi:MAG: amidohydrolase family protein, partial [Acetobacteraceae bacterium]|nr:amidohydrolase family protein [Acetobacteraceae bacterium]